MTSGTVVLRVDADRPEPEILVEAGRVIRSGRLVAFPTETVYGLGANALDDAAVRRVFEAKGRSLDDPLIVHIADPNDLGLVASDVNRMADSLARAFWPGPLTLVLAKRPIVPDSVTAGLPTVAIRCPSHAVARGLIRAAGVPVVAPSANQFTHTSPTTAQHVLDDLDGRIDLVLDGGPTTFGIESTVIDVSGDRPMLLRPGALTREAIDACLSSAGLTELEASRGERSASPGQMAKHYAPRAHVRYFQGELTAVRQAMRQAVTDEIESGRRVGVLVLDEDATTFEDVESNVVVVRAGSEADLPSVARLLFAGLRQLEESHVDTILVRDVGPDGLGLAIRDRLTRAASQRVERV